MVSCETVPSIKTAPCLSLLEVGARMLPLCGRFVPPQSAGRNLHLNTPAPEVPTQCHLPFTVCYFLHALRLPTFAGKDTTAWGEGHDQVIFPFEAQLTVHSIPHDEQQS